MIDEGSGNAVGVKEVSDDKLFQLLPGHLPIAVLVDYLDVGCDVSCSRLETLVHGPVAVHQPLCHLDCLANTVAVAIVCLDDLSE